MSQNLKIFVYYFVQNDAFDGLAEPNIYALPGSYTNINQIKSEMVYNTFPLKFENFYLRFYLEDKIQNMKVWMDYPPSATIPVYGNKVYVKVLRLPKQIKLQFKNDEYYATSKSTTKLIDTNEIKKPETVQKNYSQSPDRSHSKTSSLSNNLLNTEKFNSAGSNGPKPHQNVTKSTGRLPEKEKEKSTNKSSNNIHLINVDDLPTSKPKNSGFNMGNLDKVDIGDIENRLKGEDHGFDFVNTNDFTNQHENSKQDNGFNTGGSTLSNGNSQNININQGLFDAFNGLGGNSNDSPNNNQPSNTRPSINPQLSELNDLFGSGSNGNNGGNFFIMPENQTSYTNKTSSTNDIDGIMNTLDEDTIRDKVDMIIKKWMMGVNEKKNLRYLLGTLHEVWTSDPMWKEVSMQSLIEDDAAVKSLYRKALGQTHSDKNATKDFKTKYVSDCLYNILTQAKSELPK